MKVEESTKALLVMLADRLEAKERQKEAYRQAGDLNFESAVEIASLRMAQVLSISRQSPGAQFYEGCLYFGDYLQKEYTETDVVALIERSRTDYKAYRVLALVAHLDKSSPSLSQWETEDRFALTQPPKAPRGRFDLENLHRDRLIVSEIKRLAEAGFTVTRNKASAGASAIDVIVAALAKANRALSYDAVETIWSRRDSLRKMPFAQEIREILVKNFLS